MEKELQKEKEALSNTKKQLENAKEEVKKPFAQELELNEKLERLSELNALLNMDEKGAEDSLEDQEADAPYPEKRMLVPLLWKNWHSLKNRAARWE